MYDSSYLGYSGSYGNLIYGDLVSWGTLSLADTSPAQVFVEPLSLDTVRNYLRIVPASPPDPLEDAELQIFITAAREQAEILQGRDLVRKQWELRFDYWNAYRIELGSPLVSVDLVQYTDSSGQVTTLTQNVDFVVDTAKQPGLVCPPYNKVWPTFTPWPSSAVLMRFTSGYAPDSVFWANSGTRIKNGMLLLISSWYNQRLPFETGASLTQEYPYAVSSNLSYGARVHVR